jgi:superfamily I DNA/RNA helicase
MVRAVIDAVENKEIPGEQYKAILIDEGHDFQQEWLSLLRGKMLKKGKDSLFLFLYDKAQSIFKTGKVSLKSAGIDAVGHSVTLTKNYRNTKKIMEFAYKFAQNYFGMDESCEDIPLLKPESGGDEGESPALKSCDSFVSEIDFAKQCILKWRKNGVRFSEIAVFYPQKKHGEQLRKVFDKNNIPFNIGKEPSKGALTLLTMQSCKGLEYKRVILLGIDDLHNDFDAAARGNARLLYVAMTRAQEYLVIVGSGKSGKWLDKMRGHANYNN